MTVVVLREMNADYQQCVSTCKLLSQRSSQCDVTSQSTLSAASLTTDRLLYSCAIEMVRFDCPWLRYDTIWYFYVHLDAAESITKEPSNHHVI